MPYLKTIIIAMATGITGFAQYSFPGSCVLTKAFQTKVVYMVDGWLMIVLLALPTFISLVAEFYSNKKKKDEHPEAPGIFLTTINEAVGLKRSRFMSHAYSEGRDTFLAITQPEDQIIELLQQLFRATTATLGSSVDSIVLARFNGNSIARLYHAPRSKAPNLSNAELESGGTFFHRIQKDDGDQHIKSLKQLQIEQHAIPKRQLKDKQKFVFTKNEDGADGSIVGYPIKLKNGYIAAVLTIYSRQCNIKGALGPIEQFVKMYNDRIALELCLFNIKCEHEKVAGAKP